LKLPAEAITQIKAGVNDAAFDTSLAEAKTALVGSTITSKEVFSDTNYTSDFNLNLKVKDLGNISFVMNSTCAKGEVQEITLPTSKIKLTSEEYANLLIPTNTAITATTNVVAK